MKPLSIITLTTDFGYDDSYIATIKGIILSINHSISVIDISHSIQPQNIKQGAFVLQSAAPYFPSGSIHVAIVDPGVGSERNLILVVTPEYFFIAPDNGLLSFIIKNTSYKVYNLINESYWHKPVSSTFHGRDIFAPVAAHLSLGVSPEELGNKIDDLVILDSLEPQIISDVQMEGEVIHIDYFGNLITNIAEEMLQNENVTIEINRQTINGLCLTYSEKAGLIALIG
ncbi:MAG: SAM-dependent chlorinase/fluorinase, partial [Chloroflexi bacterium]|nr:SAM-dependent chlorinase/fluorinase [Chloroflexota bacterium]